MSVAENPARSRKPGRKPLARRWWFWALIAGFVLIVVGALAAWQLGTRVLEVKGELEKAQALTGQLKTQATALDAAGATATLDEITAHTDRAVEISGDGVWAAGEKVPFLGKNLSVVGSLARVTDDLMTEVAAPLIEVAGSIDPASLVPAGGAVNLQPIIDAGPAIARADAGVKAAAATLATLDTDGTIDQVSAAATQVSTLLETVVPITETLGTVVPLLPPALGSEAPRTYVVMFQNPAESRSLGGTALSFASITVDQGNIAFNETIPAGFKNFAASAPVITPPDGVSELFDGAFGNFIANATLRPSFTSAAQITQEMWIRDQGYAVDGIISIDPVALSYVLRATGPIPIATGDVLTSDNLVPLLLNEVYQRYNSGNVGRDNLAQDVVYAAAVDATFAALTDGSADPTALIAALTQGWDESRIMYWSAHEDEQAQLIEAGLNGELPVSDDATDRVGVYYSDNVGSKLNFYLQQSVELAQATCRVDGLSSYRVSTALTSTVDPAGVSKLSPSIVGQFKREGLEPGVQRMVVMLYAPPGSQLSGATVNGEAVELPAFHDTDYPVGKLTVSVEPGATVTVSYDLVAASAGAKALEAQITPMVNPTAVTTVPLDCATVTAK